MQIAIYFDQPGIMDYPFDKKKYFKSYLAFAQLCKQHGHTIFFVRGPHMYRGNMEFSAGYTVQDNQLILHSNVINADVIFLKGNNLSLGTADRVLNTSHVAHTCHDKFQTYKIFRQFMAPTVKITKQNVENQLATLPTEKIVLKPIYGSEGKGILIINKTEFTNNMIDFSIDYFAQAFLDSSQGIPGIMEGIHDLRLIQFNAEVKFCFIRQPKKGSFLANIAQGGSLYYIPINKIPIAALQLAHQIDTYFAHTTPRLYSIDMMFEKGKPYLLELNDQPGLPFLEENRYENAATRFHKYLLELLLQAGKS